MFDVIIIGGGPAGLTAALYSARYKIKTCVITDVVGGVTIESFKICNYPGFVEANGMELMKHFEEQVKELNVPINKEKILSISKNNSGFIVKTKEESYESKVIVIATGTVRRKLNIPGEDEFLGKGISYCATCDAAFFTDKNVVVVGGSYAAVHAALLLAEYAKKITIVYRKSALRAEPIEVERVANHEKIDIIFDANIKEIKGDNFVTKIILDDSQEIETEGVFIEIGSTPMADITNELGVELDDEGYIKVDDSQKTTADGIYAAGDVTTGSNKLRQIVTAASEGAIAATSTYDYLKKNVN